MKPENIEDSLHIPSKSSLHPTEYSHYLFYHSSCDMCSSQYKVEGQWEDKPENGSRKNYSLSCSKTSLLLLQYT